MILVLLVLASLAGSALLGVHSLRVSTSAHENALLLKADLLHARDALISYAAHYPYLYGARGSGVGHFPCPDTDGNVESTGAVWSQRLGPNPPCGSHETAKGLLPAHISFPNHRYSFATHSNAPVSYYVSGRFINNPINRSVNPEVILNAQKASVQLVELNQAVRRDVDSYPNNVKAVITPALLLLSSKPSVASWLVKRLHQLGSLSCALSSKDGVTDQQEPLDTSTDFPEMRGPLQSDWCIRYLAISKLCNQSTRFPTISVIASSMEHVKEFSISEEAHSQIITILLADKFPNEYDCEKSPESQLFIEGARARSHWFVRNHWAPWMKLVVNDACGFVSPPNCKFKKFTDVNEKANPLLIHWGPE